MKVMRDTEWDFEGWCQQFKPMDNSPVFFFKNKKFGDVIALKEAKYIDVSANLVHYYTVENSELYVSSSEYILVSSSLAV